MLFVVIPVQQSASNTLSTCRSLDCCYGALDTLF